MSQQERHSDAATLGLDGFSVVLSGAVPEREHWKQPSEDRAILEFVAHFSALIFKYGGRIVHGSHPSFTPVLVHQAKRFRKSPRTKPLTLLVSELWSNEIEVDTAKRYQRVANLLVTRRVGTGGPDDTQTRNHSLTLMREHLIERADAVVAVGGMLHDDGSFTPGVEEELQVARTRRVPSFLVGSLGGTATKLAGFALESFNTGNLLNEDERMLLAQSTDVASMAGLLVNHFMVHRPRLLLQKKTLLGFKEYHRSGFEQEDHGYQDMIAAQEIQTRRY